MIASDPGAFFEIGQRRLLGGGDFQLRAKRRGISHLESQGKGQAEAAGGAKVLRQEVAGQRRPRCPAHLSNSLSNLTGSPRTAALGHGLCALPSSMGHELYSRQLSPPSRGGGGRRGQWPLPPQRFLPCQPLRARPILGSGTGQTLPVLQAPSEVREKADAKHLRVLWVEGGGHPLDEVPGSPPTRLHSPGGGSRRHRSVPL